MCFYRESIQEDCENSPMESNRVGREPVVGILGKTASVYNDLILLGRSPKASPAELRKARSEAAVKEIQHEIMTKLSLNYPEMASAANVYDANQQGQSVYPPLPRQLTEVNRLNSEEMANWEAGLTRVTYNGMDLLVPVSLFFIMQERNWKPLTAAERAELVELRKKDL